MSKQETYSNKAEEITRTGPSPKMPPGSDEAVSTALPGTQPNELTEGEQMALYEKELRDNDWGHQPC